MPAASEMQPEGTVPTAASLQRHSMDSSPRPRLPLRPCEDFWKVESRHVRIGRPKAIHSFLPSRLQQCSESEAAPAVAQRREFSTGSESASELPESPSHLEQTSLRCVRSRQVVSRTQTVILAWTFSAISFPLTNHRSGINGAHGGSRSHQRSLHVIPLPPHVSLCHKNKEM